MTSLDFSHPEAADLGSRQKLVLAALRQAEPATAKEIAELLAMPHTTVNNALVKLLEADLASRAPRVEDGHQHYVWTTIHDT